MGSSIIVKGSGLSGGLEFFGIVCWGKDWKMGMGWMLEEETAVGAVCVVTVFG